jgi:hypothetical protein
MVPPQPSDGGGFRRDAGSTAAPLSTIARIVRMGETNDLLLYMTAIFGVLMPALMYFFYRAVHQRYAEYNNRVRLPRESAPVSNGIFQRKNAKRRERQEKRKSRTVCILYCGSSSSKAPKRIGYGLAEELDQFDPIVCSLTGEAVARLKSNKVVTIAFQSLKGFFRQP